MSDERRKHPRYQKVVGIEYQYKDRQRVAFTKDISLGGVAFLTPIPKDVHEEIQIRFLNESPGDEVEIAATVARVDSLDNEYLTCAQYAELPGEVFQKLQTLIEAH